MSPNPPPKEALLSRSTFFTYLVQSAHTGGEAEERALGHEHNNNLSPAPAGPPLLLCFVFLQLDTKGNHKSYPY